MSRLGWSALLLLAGCGGSGYEAASQPQPQSPPANTNQNPDPADPEEIKEPVREVAGVGSGIKGRSLDDSEGFVVTPAKTLFGVRERLVFEVQVPHALNLYKATVGRMPQTHQEFIEKVINPNQIKLPTLPPGQTYVFDPEKEMLMVEKRGNE